MFYYEDLKELNDSSLSLGPLHDLLEQNSQVSREGSSFLPPVVYIYIFTNLSVLEQLQ